jgi:hypothetical protein
MDMINAPTISTICITTFGGLFQLSRKKSGIQRREAEREGGREGGKWGKRKLKWKGLENAVPMQ